MKRRCNCTGRIFAAFGLGLLFATILPAHLILVLAAIALVFMGFSLVKN